MSSIIKEIKSIFSNMNKISKKMFLHGSILIIILFIASFITYLSAGRFGDYYTLIRLSEDFFVCAKNCMASIYIPAAIIEILVIANKIDETNEK